MGSSRDGFDPSNLNPCDPVYLDPQLSTIAATGYEGYRQRHSTGSLVALSRTMRGKVQRRGLLWAGWRGFRRTDERVSNNPRSSRQRSRMPLKLPAFSEQPPRTCKDVDTG